MLLRRYKATITYVIAILILNKLFVVAPLFLIAGELISPMDFFAGTIFVFRDFVQREIGHKVIFPMIFAGVMSYFVSNSAVALASISAFFVSEFIDWIIFTFTRKPLAQRLFWSAALSCPVDSALFLYLLNQLNWLSYTIMTVTKILGVIILIMIWQRRQTRGLVDIRYA